MKKIFFSALIMLVMALLAMVWEASPALTQEKKTIVIASDGTIPFMHFLDVNNEMVGFSADYMKAAAKEGGYEVKLINIPWGDLFTGLRNKEFDAICSSVTITEDRKKVMDFSIPYFIAYQGIMVPIDSQVKFLPDLKGKKVGLLKDATSINTVNRIAGIESVVFDTVLEAVEELYNGRLDAVVFNDIEIDAFISGDDKYKGAFKVASVLNNPVDIEKYGVAVDKNNTEVLDLINKGIAGVRAKGIDHELLEKWLSKK